METKERSYAWYDYKGEPAVIVRTDLKEDTYEVEKFNGIKAVEEAIGTAVLRISDIEKKGIEITDDDVCLAYDDYYTRLSTGIPCPSQGCPIVRAEVPNIENEQHTVLEFVTEDYITF